MQSGADQRQYLAAIYQHQIATNISIIECIYKQSLEWKNLS